MIPLAILVSVDLWGLFLASVPIAALLIGQWVYMRVSLAKMQVKIEQQKETITKMQEKQDKQDSVLQDIRSTVIEVKTIIERSKL